MKATKKKESTEQFLAELRKLVEGHRGCASECNMVEEVECLIEDFFPAKKNPVKRGAK